MQYKSKHSGDFTKLAIFIILAIFLTDIATQARAESTAVAAPDFTLPSRDGDNRRLLEERGNIVMVNFWASWCGPCREELPAMEALQQKYQDLGFTVLAVNVDDKPEKANILLDDIEVTFPVLFDSNGNVSETYNVSAMPTTVFVDRNGLSRLTHKGYKSGDERKYEKAIKLLLRE
ncbi:TlpA disulfide reductase family protein [Alteromonas facilis]|uniref:TlpA disulfide reductase family protein n=1 Tax=Alteromonas facilis TaxID=2048004 RepID=UPI000C283F5C|nr:TlpA disulfide reductase family protein [Alteromonas facilis]